MSRSGSGQCIDIENTPNVPHEMKLRAAKGDDIPVLMEMVAAMPEAATVPTALKASAADWQRDLGHGFDGIVAIKDGNVVGAALTSFGL
jgi:hypothetical protein